MLLFGAKSHDVLDASAVVPTAIEDDDLTGRGKMRNVALEVHLRLFPARRCRKRDNAKYPRAYPVGDGFDCTPLAGGVAPLENDDDPQSLVLDPVLQPTELNLQLS